MAVGDPHLAGTLADAPAGRACRRHRRIARIHRAAAVVQHGRARAGRDDAGRVAGRGARRRPRRDPRADARARRHCGARAGHRDHLPDRERVVRDRERRDRGQRPDPRSAARRDMKHLAREAAERCRRSTGLAGGHGDRDQRDAALKGAHAVVAGVVLDLGEAEHLEHRRHVDGEAAAQALLQAVPAATGFSASGPRPRRCPRPRASARRRSRARIQSPCSSSIAWRSSIAAQLVAQLGRPDLTTSAGGSACGSSQAENSDRRAASSGPRVLGRAAHPLAYASGPREQMKRADLVDPGGVRRLMASCPSMCALNCAKASSSREWIALAVDLGDVDEGHAVVQPEGCVAQPLPARGGGGPRREPRAPTPRCGRPARA